MEEEDSSKASSSLRLTAEEAQQQAPHEAVFLVLSYLRVYELLVMSQVCTSLRDAVSNDVLPWLNIVVERPLSSRISDEILMRFTSKAKGKLKTLALINCIHITNEGLQRVVEHNPLINKLHIPGCTSITPEGALRAVKTLCEGSNCLSTLSINGIYNLQKEHLDMLALYLKKNLPLEEQQERPYQPLYYHERGNFSVSRNEESQRIIDLEVCPKCSEVRMVYDCPKGECKRREFPLDQCRACNFCITRCENCGGCIGSEEMEEAACSDILCLECWLQEHPKCSFCNKPYCKQHTSWWCTTSDSRFLCRVCEENSHGYTYMDDV